MTDHDELGTQLTRALTEHADVMAGSSLGLAEVRGRARSIRRRRTATAVAGVAVAVAVVIPTVTAVSHTGGKSEPGPATDSPSPTRTATALDERAPLDVRDLAQGKPPGVDYLTRTTVHLSDGGTGEVRTTDPVDRFAVLSDGTAVYLTRDGRGRTHIEVTDSGGVQHGPYPAEDGLAVDASRAAATWVSPDGQVHAWLATDTGPTTIATPVPGVGPQVDGMAGRCSVGAPCRVLVRTTDEQTGEVTDHIASSDGTVAVAAPSGRFVTVADLAGSGLITGYTRIGQSDSCSAVGSGTGPVAWETCDHSLLAFSPGATSVSADAAFRSGLGSSVFAAYDAGNGGLLFEHRSTAKAQAFVLGSVWEDDTHLLATTFQGGMWYVVRFDLNGSMELAVPATKGDDVEAPFVLAGQR
jgi:hypothetical protein